MLELLWSEVLLRLGTAAACGAVVGWDREWNRKPAGLRTMMMVSLGAASFILVTLSALDELANDNQADRLDPSRAIQGIVGGIGFLGAGTIIQARGSVQGVTTAAAIWVVGAMGIACGLGEYFLALATLGFATVILVLIAMLEAAIAKHTGLIPYIKEKNREKGDGKEDGSGED